MDELDLMLLELKDTSELMIDLAYSSLLYNNRDIAEEVFADGGGTGRDGHGDPEEGH